LPASASNFSHLQNDLLATALPLPVASLDAQRLSVVTETTRNRETGGSLEQPLTNRVSETQSELDALEDLARRNDIEPGTLRGQ
jgi:hypothetical protein